MWTRLPKQAAKGSLFEQDQYELCEPIKRRGESKCVSPFEELEKRQHTLFLIEGAQKRNGEVQFQEPETTT